jgi:YidC/Oxa1 family membrane protein insertase
MERRVLLAITLSFLVLFLFQRFVVPPPARVPVNASAPAAAGPEASAPSARVVPAAPVAPTERADASAGAPASSDFTVGETSARDIVVETRKVRAVFSNQGARVMHWVLKDFRTNTGEPLDLVPAAAGEQTRPFTLTFDDPMVTDRIGQAIYRVTVNGNPAAGTIDAAASAQTVVFETATRDGISVRKTFALEPDSYVVAFGAEVKSGDQRLNPTIEWGAGLGDEIARTPPTSFFSPAYTLPPQALYYLDGGVERLDPAASGTQEGSFRYAGVDDHYFASIVVNEEGKPYRLAYAPVQVAAPDNPALVGKYVSYSVRFNEPQDQTRFFYGPKIIEDLRAIHPEYTRVINFGIFSWLAVPLLGALKWVQTFVGNWGWSIIVLTLLINLAMFPLRHKSVVSMRRMQEIQPQMKAIQDRYAKYKITDPERQKMNTEVMELYKAKGVNPASGCVPMLLTLPFLIAFYQMLSQAIEIRGAHFAGWITNLSAPDPYFITPILMGAAQFWQTKMTPAAGDPTQQKIMLFMPIMFTVMSLSFPSGLVLYWLVSTMFTIGQQYFTNYLIGPPPRPAAK